MRHRNIHFAIAFALTFSLATNTLAQTYISRPGLPANDLNSLSGDVYVGTTNFITRILDVHATLSAPGTTLSQLNTYSDSQTILSGGTVDNGLSLLDSSIVTLSGGTVNNGLSVRNYATINVSGGTANNTLAARDNGVVNFLGGTVNNSLFSFDSSSVRMSGGTVNGDLVVSIFGGTSTVELSGGTVTHGLVAGGISICNISGGTVADQEYDSFGGTISLHGHNITATFDGLGTGNFGDYGGFFALNGTLSDGTNLTGYRYWEKGASGNSPQHLVINASSTPEPGALQVGLLVFATALGLKARKRRRSSIAK